MNALGMQHHQWIDSMGNPRRTNGSRRNKIIARWRAIGDPCHLCGQAIDYTLPPGHPMSFEVDEIVPVSRGGDPYDFDNTQPAHRRCNQAKGNRLPEVKPVLLPHSRSW